MAAALALVEALGWLLLSLRAPSLPAQAAESLRPVPAAGTPEVFFMSKESIHPFLGFVQDPAVDEIATRRGRTVRRDVDGQGFVRQSFVAGSGPDHLSVVVTGGSVALQFTAATGRQLAESLATTSSGSSRRVTVRNLAMGGYKQPQQLFALSWISLVEGPPDLVINLDGYNDLVLGYTENLREGAYPFFPRGWQWRASSHQPMSLQLAIGKAAWLTEERSDLAATFWSSAASRSSLARWLWIHRDTSLANAVAAAERQARAVERRYSMEARSFATHGPRFEARSRAAYVEHAAQIWQASSRQMDGICRSLGCAYFHFLQPNLHDVGSKRLSASEQDLAGKVDEGAAAIVRLGYPALSAAGAALRAEGVDFVDLRQALHEEAGALYVDSCCHLSERGYRILAAEVLDAVDASSVDAASAPGKARP